MVLKEIKSMDEQGREQANALLDDAKEQGYTSVIVLGFKHGKVYTALSKNELLVTLGALEVAKVEILAESRE